MSHLSEKAGLSISPESFIPAAATASVQLNGDMAIVGVACRFPSDINSLADLWNVMSSKGDLTSEASLSRWDSDAIIADLDYDAKVLDRIRYGGFLSDEVIETFNNKLFGISDVEAKHMHPLQRLPLDVGYEALMDGGYSMDSIRGRCIGVFVGASAGLNGDQAVSGELSVYDATGFSLAVVGGRISFCFGIQGTCYTSDTACSSSLAALHSARRSLQLSLIHI